MSEELIKKLIKALEFYAEERHFRKDNHPMLSEDVQIHLPAGYGFILDDGDVARKVLQECSQ